MARAKQKDGFWETLKTIFWALLIAAAFRTILFQPFSIPSGSMKPTLLIGDYLFVSKFAYGYSRYSLPFSPDLFEGRILAAEPKRGDVVVFKHPGKDACSEGPIQTIVSFAKRLTGTYASYVDDCSDYVKRLIGLPGDEIQVIGSQLYINGEAVPTVRTEDFVEPRVPRGNPPRPPRCQRPLPGVGGACIKEQWIETLPNGVSHPVLNIDGVMGDADTSPRGPDNTPVFKVPEGHFFFMGDNRDNSLDSRADVGFVPFENLIGRADMIAFSSDGPIWQFWNWRGDRFFKMIH
ncbi:signal peptidase I [Rhodobacteraceae bacterium NNCM2]|nr:signal peptidase I [Coraliihabitans acroporae]